MRAPSDISNRLSLRAHRGRWALAAGLAVLLLLLAFAQRLASFYTDLLWFRSVGFSAVWVKTLAVQLGLGATFTVVLVALIWGNLWLADRFAPAGPPPEDQLVTRWQDLTGRHRGWPRAVVALAFGAIGGISAHTQWNNWLLFSNSQTFTGPNSADPVYHMNAGFYVFELPFVNWFVDWIFAALVVTLLLCILADYLNGGIRPHASSGRVAPKVKAHISVLLAAMVLTEGANYYLQRLSLVLSTRYPPVAGATYTDVHAVGPALLLLVAISVVAAGLFLYNVRRQGWVLPLSGVALWGLVWALVGNAYPAIIQNFVVKPAQNVKEQPYIQDNIQATTAAYGLGSVTQQNFQGDATLTSGAVTGDSAQAVANRRTLANVAVWDAGSSDINQIFTRQQGFRGYYQLSGPSADRYPLVTGNSSHPQETPVLVSARELNSPQVPPSWVNRHLEFTHGYSAVVAPANQSGVTLGGYPNFSLSDIPGSGQPSLTNQPRIYFDTSPQSAYGYVVANSAQPELDYQDPLTNNEQTAHYAGNGGVAAGGLLRRLAFAVSFGDINLLLSGQVTPTSRILYYRNVVQRLQKAAPFLAYDSHPYPVILSGRLYWVEDAYTTSANYPYSEPADTARLPASSGLAGLDFNYVRNSVKAVVDAYTGKMWFFVQDPTDPVLQAYEAAFPGLFTPMSKAQADIPGIASHWRYPQDLFTVQTNMYTLYHQQTASQFYTQSQAWGVPQNPARLELNGGGGGSTPPGLIPPVYELMALPGQAPTQQSFVLVQPFVPASAGDKSNLTAFMTASSDPNDYGQLTLFTVPAGQSVDGPSLVSNAVKANNVISEELSLLNQNGSRVLLGNLSMVPIGQTLVYFQPLYVEPAASGSGATAPRLGDVIVVYDHQAFDSGVDNPPSVYTALCRVTNPGGGHPFASLCPGGRPAPASLPKPATRRRSPGASTTTTSPAVTSTTVPARVPTTRRQAPTTTVPTSAPAPGSSVARYLAEAQQDFALAKRALQSGDLGTYQNDIQAGEAAVALADQLEHRVATTTVPRSTTAATTTTTTAQAKNGAKSRS
jgi:hypothetical protein